MQIKEALKKYISEKTAKGEVIHLTKVKGQIGKIEMTIGSGKGSGTNCRYAIWEYTKTCRCGQVAKANNDPYRLAEYLIETMHNRIVCARAWVTAISPDDAIRQAKLGANGAGYVNNGEFQVLREEVNG